MTTRLTIMAWLCAFVGCQSLQPASSTDDGGTLEDLATPAVLLKAAEESSNAERNLVSRLPTVPGAEIQLVAFVEDERILPPEPDTKERLQLPSPSANATPGMNLEELVDLALANNPALARSAAQVRALRGKWVQVGLPPNTTIGYLAGEMGDNGTAGQQGGYLGQQVITAGKLGLNRAVVAREIVQAQQRFAAQQQRVITDVRTAFFDVLVAKKQMSLARQLVNISAAAVGTSQDLLRAKEVNEVALLQTQVQAEDTQIVLRRAENENRAAWRRLSSVVGVPDLTPQPLDGDLDDAITEIQWDEAFNRLLRESPEISAAQAELDRARWALRRARAEVMPNLNTQFSLQRDGTTGDIIAGAQVGLPVPILNRNQGAIRQAQAEITAAEQNIRRLELSLRERLADEFRDYASSRFEVEKYSQDILPKAQRTYDLVTQGYRQGEVGYLDQLAAQRTYFQTNLAFVRALRELLRAKFRIDGLLLEGSLKGGAGG